MLIFTSLCLLCCMQVKGMTSEKIKLDFHDESIDDMYSTCKDEMEKLVFAKYDAELTGKEYGTYWKEEANNIKKDVKILSNKELQAIRVYTENKNGVYRVFNNDVRTGKNVYGTSFKFHILYFLLASAVQKLKKDDKGVCYTTYRRNSRTFQVMDKIRFGNFVSSSLNPEQKEYGNETCYEIYTCHGAVIEPYSAHPEEREVLIPPYEVFTTAHQKVEKLKDCKIVYVLKSHGTQSNLDCKLAK